MRNFTAPIASMSISSMTSAFPTAPTKVSKPVRQRRQTVPPNCSWGTTTTVCCAQEVVESNDTLGFGPEVGAAWARTRSLMDFAYRIGAVTETVCAARREAVDGGGGEVAVLQSLLSKVERELVGTVVSLHGLKTEKYNGFVGTILGLANEAGEPRLKVE